MIRVTADGLLHFGGRRLRCALGRSGLRAAKREGDGATPIGTFPLRQVLYRADRGPRPATPLPCRAIDPADGWCDDPADFAHYNRAVRLPHASSHERLWRDDALYDLILIPGHNDAPAVPGLGSAVFVHVATPDYAPTEGCVALAPADLAWLLAAVDPATMIAIGAEDGP